MSPDAAALGKLASSIADGAPVDWGQIEAETPPRDRRLIRHLRLVESIASLYRSLPDLEETATDDLPAGPRWGRLIMLDRIGHGTSCDVHRAFDTDLHRPVALKLLHQEGIGGAAAHDRILQEARRLARVRHPHVVQVLGAEQHVDRVGLWMELVEGESLDQIVRARGPYGAGEAAGIGQDICSALAAVHAAQLLHRDVKAQNVMREQGGRIVLMDFGTGEERQRAGGTPRLVGTPLYLAPEIFASQHASEQSDLYSVGVLLFFLVTGEFPVSGATLEQLAAAHAGHQARRLRDVRPDVPSGFVEVVDRALAHNPADRYQSAGELEAALRDSSRRLQPVPLVASVAPPSYTRRALARGAIAATLALVVALIAWLRLAPPAAPPVSVVRVAVLPLLDNSPTPSGYLADGLTDQLIATLGQIKTLRVTALASAGRFRGSTASDDEIARQLGVDTLVKGTVTTLPAAPNEALRARVNVRVIKAGLATPLLVRSFDWIAGDSLALEAGLSTAIANAVTGAVASADLGSLSAAHQSNPNAEEAYFRGRAQLATFGPDAARRALREFERATSLDPQHAGAFAGASRAYVTLGQFSAMSQGEARQAALAAARTAIALDDNLAEAHRAIADVTFYFDWDWEGAEREYRKTLELNPSLSVARRTYAELLAMQRRFPQSFRQVQLASDLDPESSDVALTHAVVLLYAGQFPEAEAVAQAALLQQPESAGAFLMRGRIAEARGQYEEALGFVRRSTELAGNIVVPVQVTLLQLEARAGRPEDARAGLRALEKASASGQIRIGHRDRGYLNLALGDENGAIDEFQQAFDERESSLIWISVDPRLDPLRANPRFKAILKRMRLS